MNASLRAHRAYGAHASSTRSAKGIEYQVIARVTREMATAAQSGPGTFQDVVKALDLNRRLWRILAMDVAHEENQLPEALRAQIFSLAEFTFEHTRKVLTRRESIVPLIEVNTAILRGLNPGRS